MTWLGELVRAVAAILLLAVGAALLGWGTRTTRADVWPGAAAAREQWEARWAAAS